MKRRILALTAVGLLMGGPVFADTAKHEDAMCAKHCNLMDLGKKVDALKAQQNVADKMATKEHLKKDIEQYEKKLQELKAELDPK